MSQRANRVVLLSVILAFVSACVVGGPASRPTIEPQPARRLSIHFLDVGQGDAALVVAPNGEAVMIDNGPPGSCDQMLAYARRIGITEIDYHIASHYHADHVGCTQALLSTFPLARGAFDRGGSYSSQQFSGYLQAVGNHRLTVTTNQTFTMDATSRTPVTVRFLTPTSVPESANENTKSILAVVEFGGFHAVFGGDLTGTTQGSEIDEETALGPLVGHVEVYKVHHHCSRFSSNQQWLAATTPKVGVISVGQRNGYGHPTAECLARLHSAQVKTYWTSAGAGAIPDPSWDVVAGTTVVTASDVGGSFTVRHGDVVESFLDWDARLVTRGTGVTRN